MDLVSLLPASDHDRKLPFLRSGLLSRKVHSTAGITNDTNILKERTCSSTLDLREQLLEIMSLKSVLEDLKA